jgi:hypothetical protein
MSSVDSRGPVFISYRQSDGSGLAMDLAWALRAAGVPVWHDQADLLPGDTNRRLEEALESGLSGAVLVVTPDIAASTVIRDVELPRLLDLERTSEFTFSIVSIIELSLGKLDYEAPDRLLTQPAGTLQRLDQQPIFHPEQRAAVAHSHARRRLHHLRPDIAAAGGVLSLDVQTRISPFAARADADLVLRLRPPAAADRRPSRAGLEDLQHFLAGLPQLVALAGGKRVLVRGGAHLSAAFALGAALPTTLVGQVEVVDTQGATWALDGNAPVPGPDRHLEHRSPPVTSHPKGPVLLYLDLRPALSNAAFEDFHAFDPGRLAARAHLGQPVGQLLDPADAAAIVGEAEYEIRTLAGAHHTNEIHLLLRCPYGVALLLGRTLNTMRVHLYEWEDGPDDAGAPAPPRYVPSLVVRSGAGGSPIESVTLITRPTV